MHPAILPVVGAVVFVGTGLTLLRARALVKLKGTPPSTTIPPDFKASPPSQQAIPAGKSAVGFPVLTQAQMAALSAAEQEVIRQDALKGILTLTGTNGTLFADRSDDPQVNLGNLFKPGDLIVSDFIVANAALAAQNGVSLAPASGNVLFEVTGTDNGTTIPCVSRDPRVSGNFNIPLKAITGAGAV